MIVSPLMILLLHLLATTFMTGLVWFVQIVHYPLLSKINPCDVPSYEQDHTRRTGWIVAPAMLLEASTGVYLIFLDWNSNIRVWLYANLFGLMLIWLSTWSLQIPCHDRLCQQWDAVVQQRLVRSNWLRTWTWTIRSSLLVYLIHGILVQGH